MIRKPAVGVEVAIVDTVVDPVVARRVEEPLDRPGTDQLGVDPELNSVFSASTTPNGDVEAHQRHRGIKIVAVVWVNIACRSATARLKSSLWW